MRQEPRPYPAIVLACLQRGLSIEQAAATSDVTTETWCNAATGRHAPNRASMAAIARALGVTVGEVFPDVETCAGSSRG